MPPPQLVDPVPRTAAPALQGSQGGAARELPADVLHQASRRLQIAALTMAVLYPIGWILGRAYTVKTFGPEHTSPHLLVADLVVAASIAVSVGLYVYARRPRGNPRTVLDIGLAYMVGIGFSLAILMHWLPRPSDFPVVPTITWIGPIMLMFAAILPSTMGKTLFAGLLATSMNPLSMMMMRARGTWDYGSEFNVLLMHYPDFLLVPVAVVISRVMTGLGQQVAKARELGSYELGERIGYGAMGEVYRASHRMFCRPAAIKLIRPDTIAPGDTQAATLAVRRFRREAEAAARLRSPHTVALYDFGVTGDQVLYFVMELLDGLDMETLVREHGPLPANRAIYLLRQVCESLEEAHATGLVHRDVKPANIHVGRVGLKHDFVKVLDFGLVKSLGGGEATESLTSLDGLAPGTPAYMPPEAARGEALDGRADIYALGCVAYYLLTGTLVFEADNAVKMIASHLQLKPTPPSRRGAKVPAELEALILRCLEKDPKDRPAGADEVRWALKGMAIDPWTQAEAIVWWQENATPRKLASPAA